MNLSHLRILPSRGAARLGPLGKIVAAGVAFIVAVLATQPLLRAGRAYANLPPPGGRFTHSLSAEQSKQARADAAKRVEAAKLLPKPSPAPGATTATVVAVATRTPKPTGLDLLTGRGTTDTVISPSASAGPEDAATPTPTPAPTPESDEELQDLVRKARQRRSGNTPK